MICYNNMWVIYYYIQLYIIKKFNFYLIFLTIILVLFVPGGKVRLNRESYTLHGVLVTRHFFNVKKKKKKTLAVMPDVLKKKKYHCTWTCLDFHVSTVQKKKIRKKNRGIRFLLTFFAGKFRYGNDCWIRRKRNRYDPHGVRTHPTVSLRGIESWRGFSPFPAARVPTYHSPAGFSDTPVLRRTR